MSLLPAPPGRGPSRQDIAYQWLKRHIGTLPRYEGTFLTEDVVSEATGTSRTPVREALLRLEAEGFLTIMPKKGAFVPPVSDAEVEAVMQARQLVEDWAVRRSVPSSASLIKELERLIREQESLLDDPVGFIDRDREFHRAIVHTAGNPVLVNFYETLRERQVRMGLRAIAGAEDRVQVVLAEHAAIVAGIRSGDSIQAAAAVAAHLISTLAALHLPAVANWDALPTY